MSETNNFIEELIYKKMEEDGWAAYTHDSISSYLLRLTNDEIIEFAKEKGLV